jgi:uncharacterized protein YxeA
MKKILLLALAIVVVVGTSVYFIKKHSISKVDLTNPKISASVNSFNKSQKTAAKLKSLKFNKDSDYVLLSQAIASIPRNNVLKVFNN